MKNWILLGAIVLTLVGYGRVYENREWAAAYGSALNAYRVAYNYRDAVTLLYEPRRRVLDAAIENLVHQPTPSFESDRKLSTLQICAGDIDLYRESQGTNVESVRLGKVSNLDGEADVKKMTDSCGLDTTEATLISRFSR